MVRRAITATYKTARRAVIGVIGASVLVLGIAMILLPGPAVVVIPAGLAILSLEFAFARRWLHRVRETTQGAVGAFRDRPPSLRSAASFWRERLRGRLSR